MCGSTPAISVATAKSAKQRCPKGILPTPVVAFFAGPDLGGVQLLMFLGSSCIYLCDCPKLIQEEYLLSDPLEPTNEPYAIAKIAGIKPYETYNAQYGRQYISHQPLWAK